MNKLHKRIFEISYKYQLSHIGSCITAVDIIDEIYNIKEENEPFCLGNSHAALALYVILEKYYGFNAEKLYEKHGTHANRSISEKIFISGGSLSIVESIALGFAISNQQKNVYLLSSDGTTTEGLFWETLRIAADNNILNLKWFINANGFSAYDAIDINKLKIRIKAFTLNSKLNVEIINTNMNKYPVWLSNIHGHYVILDFKKYQELYEKK